MNYIKNYPMSNNAVENKTTYLQMIRADGDIQLYNKREKTTFTLPNSSNLKVVKALIFKGILYTMCSENNNNVVFMWKNGVNNEIFRGKKLDLFIFKQGLYILVKHTSVLKYYNCNGCVETGKGKLFGDNFNFKTEYCAFFDSGKCKKGENCKFSHNKDEVYFGMCSFGDRCKHVNCDRSHPGETAVDVYNRMGKKIPQKHSKKIFMFEMVNDIEVIEPIVQVPVIAEIFDVNPVIPVFEIKIVIEKFTSVIETFPVIKKRTRGKKQTYLTYGDDENAKIEAIKSLKQVSERRNILSKTISQTIVQNYVNYL